MWAAIEAMLATSPVIDAEEYAIHDYEGFEGVRISESTSLETLAQIAAFLSEHGTLGAAVVGHFSGDLNEAREALEDRYLGRYTTLADYVQEVTEGSLTIPTALQYYIDWEAMARDAELNGEVFTVCIAYDEVHVFAG